MMVSLGGNKVTATSSLQNGSDPAVSSAGGDDHPHDDHPQDALEVGSELYGRFMELLPQVRSEIGALDATRDAINVERQERVAAINEEYQDRLAEIDAQRKKLNGLLKAMGEEPESPPVKRRGAGGGSKGVTSVSYKVLGAIMDAIEAQGDEKFTALGIHEQARGHWSEPQTYNAFTLLRAKEYIGKAGKEDRPNGRTFFRILDREVGAELRAELAAEGKQSSSRPAKRGKPVHPGVPTQDSVDRYVAAIRQYDGPTFGQDDIEQVLGLGPKRSKITSRVFHFLVERGFLENLGKDPDTRPQWAKTIYRIADENAMIQPSLFKGETHGA